MKKNKLFTDQELNTLKPKLTVSEFELLITPMPDLLKKYWLHTPIELHRERKQLIDLAKILLISGEK